MDDALLMPIAWTDSDGVPWVLTSHWGALGGRLECLRVDLESLDAHEDRVPRPVTASTWRAVPLAQILERARHDVTSMIHGLNRLSPEQIQELRVSGPNERTRRYAQDLSDAPPEARRIASQLLPLVSPGDPAAVPPRVLEAARIYQEAWSTQNRRPTRTVAEEMGVSPSAAAKLVARAREAGLLPPTSRGRAGGLVSAAAE